MDVSSSRRPARPGFDGAQRTTTLARARERPASHHEALPLVGLRLAARAHHVHTWVSVPRCFSMRFSSGQLRVVDDAGEPVFHHQPEFAPAR